QIGAVKITTRLAGTDENTHRHPFRQTGKRDDYTAFESSCHPPPCLLATLSSLSAADFSPKGKGLAARLLRQPCDNRVHGGPPTLRSTWEKDADYRVCTDPWPS